ncbi:MAG: DegV family protein [Oscillospiraceae bacterium]|jgi:DegV family protein with EDD domain|nr:DegV family protein [Oscillospiraceae bacterium]
MRIKVIADSTCDISPDLLTKYNIRRTPLTIVKGESGFKDGDEITPKEIFDYVDSGKGVCRTASINISEYSQVYAEEKSNGADAILHFTMSALLSAGYANAVVAAREFENVYPIDTMSLSTGAGWLVLYAAELIEQGIEITELVEMCEAKKMLSDASFVIDTLKYMYKGGRCSGIAALGANMLNLKPCLELRGGKIEVGKKYRGNIEKVVRQYIEDRLKGRGDLDLSRAIITHTFFNKPEFVESIVQFVRELMPFDEVFATDAGCTISNHCGPGTLGILIYRK